MELTPATTTASRLPATCGVVNAAFTPTDTFALALTGDADVQLDVPASVATNVAIPLTVTETQGGVVTAQSNDGSVLFTFSIVNATALDATPLDSVVITMTSLPTVDGDSLGAELDLRFDDGRALDQVYSAPLQTIPAPCH